MASMEEILEMRNPDSQHAYQDFFDNYVGAVYGKRDYRTNKLTMLVSEFCTKSDEAFALLCLENNWDRWMDMCRRNDFKSSDVPPKFTSGGKNNGDGRSRQYMGWDAEATEVYNKRFLQVKKDRKKKTAVAFETEYMEEQKRIIDQYYEGRKKPSPVRPKESKVAVLHDLWTDDELENSSDEESGSEVEEDN